MNKIAKIIVLTFSIIMMLSSLVCCTPVFTEDPENCKLSYNIYGSGDNTDRIEGELIFVAPKGWKIPKIPRIIVAESNANFKIRENEFRKISDSKYVVLFYLTKNKAENPTVKISTEIALCSDICTIISKEIIIDCGKAQKMAAPANNDTSNAPQNLWIMMLLGFLGGLLLNLMPCVLPVILMKLRSFLASSDSKRSAILGTISGNYASFAAFAAFLMILKAVGEQVGWGMHFQNPYFLAAVAVVLFLLCLYSLEILQIPLFLEVGSAKRQVFWENFVSSIVVAIVAIPCTAPLLGTAAAFAIQGSAWDMAAVFFCISTGFSAPYMAALINKSGERTASIGKLHKYGRFAKIAANAGTGVTLAWILYLLGGHIGFTGIAAIFGLFAVSTALFVKKYPKIAVICLVPIFFAGAKYENTVIEEQKRSSDTVTMVKEILDGTNPIAQERIVIINISADWCLTCKYNKINVLNSKEIQELIKEKNILYIECDMTHKNDDLMQIIKDHGRIGIPFMMILGPGNRKAKVMPEILRVEDVIEGVNIVEAR